MQRVALLNAPLLRTGLRPLVRQTRCVNAHVLLQTRCVWTRQGGGASRIPTRPAPPARKAQPQALPAAEQEVAQQIPEDPPVWSGEILPPRRDAKRSLAQLLSHDQLVITRQIEMLNIFLGFEQSNKYAINTADGKVVGYILEEPRGLLSMLSRQFLRTHRPFRAMVLDADGSPILWLRRSFAWINSRVFVQHQSFDDEPDALQASETETLETFGVVQQRFHVWRRRYELYLKDSSLLNASQGRSDAFNQFGAVDAGFLAWTFPVQDEASTEIACVDRNWRGLGREFFTDSGQYALSFTPRPDENGIMPDHTRTLDIQERALLLALSVTCDFDYFSRHSDGGGTGWLAPLLIIFGAE